MTLFAVTVGGGVRMDKYTTIFLCIGLEMLSQHGWKRNVLLTKRIAEENRTFGDHEKCRVSCDSIIFTPVLLPRPAQATVNWTSTHNIKCYLLE